MNILFKADRFGSLSVHQLHDILRLRTDIFVVEQNCPYSDIDGRDPECIHVHGTAPGGAIVAYARIIPPHDGRPPHIGRVVVRIDHRGMGLAHALMRFTLTTVENEFGSSRAVLAAQSHLEAFYAGHGFRRNGENYLWDGILHVDMVRE